MHANTENLLLIKDGKKTQYDEHVSRCDRCQKELDAITQVQIELQNTSTQVPHDMWNKIQSEYQSGRNSKNTTGLIRAIYTLAATILITGGLIVFSNYQQSQSNQGLYQEINQLMAQSSSLENLLSMQTDRVEIDNNNLFNIEKIKWRLMLIDQQIQASQFADIDEQITLWQDRIRALQAINQNTNIENKTQQL